MIRLLIETHAIEQLIHRYSGDHLSDWDQHEAVFAPDATISRAPFEFKAVEHGDPGTNQRWVSPADLIHRADSGRRLRLDPRATSTSMMGRGPAPGLSGDEPDTLLNWETYAVYYDDIAKIGGA
jgi:hypothetical protein